MNLQSILRLLGMCSHNTHSQLGNGTHVLQHPYLAVNTTAHFEHIPHIPCCVTLLAVIKPDTYILSGEVRQYVYTQILIHQPSLTLACILIMRL